MTIAILHESPLIAGDFLTREEFLDRWEQCPEIKQAELIGGVVYMPPPVGLDHGYSDTRMITWLSMYAIHTMGTCAGNNATWLMLDDAPQPDAFLHLGAHCGGSVRLNGKYASGAPELAAEICHSSRAYDLHQKLALYESAGVLEYITVLLQEHQVRWHRLIAGQYEVLPLPSDGVLRSIVFPGLWLDVAAFLRHDMKRVLQVLQDGINSPEHAQFVTDLEQHKSR